MRKEKDKDDNSIYDKLIKAYNVKSLTTDGQKVNNKDGIYQIVKITTDQSMPREVNYLTHSSAGILSEKFVNQVNQEYPKGYGIAVPFLQIQMEKMRFMQVAHTL